MNTKRYKTINTKVILKRYILIFTLALISCAGTNYIHSLTTQEDLESMETNDSLKNGLENKKDVVGENGVKINHSI